MCDKVVFWRHQRLIK